MELVVLPAVVIRIRQFLVCQPRTACVGQMLVVMPMKRHIVLTMTIQIKDVQTLRVAPPIVQRVVRAIITVENAGNMVAAQVVACIVQELAVLSV